MRKCYSVLLWCIDFYIPHSHYKTLQGLDPSSLDLDFTFYIVIIKYQLCTFLTRCFSVIYIPHSLYNTLVTKVCFFVGKQIYNPHSKYCVLVQNLKCLSQLLTICPKKHFIIQFLNSKNIR